jgi:uncharacterized protein
VLMGIYGAIMLLKRNDRQDSTKKQGIWPVVISGGVVGFLAGLLGVGGGFLIVPSLVLFLNMPMKSAAGTSLLIIAANSSVALLGHRPFLGFEGGLLVKLVPAALLATYVGVKLTGKFSAHQLRQVFGIFIILLGVFMIANNTALLFKH